ncbi:hypothetical protein IF1G_06073 [Cordyceps javanica]|uniref:Uncharacterized protein n=1 Tax=Cordyceps javanica TaxID=43265 RepID=A0A545V043_9HYPO|nr:hypothetical protein IF1G_06073 [Cordyceps javanica]
MNFAATQSPRRNEPITAQHTLHMEHRPIPHIRRQSPRSVVFSRLAGSALFPHIIGPSPLNGEPTKGRPLILVFHAVAAVHLDRGRQKSSSSLRRICEQKLPTEKYCMRANAEQCRGASAR